MMKKFNIGTVEMTIEPNGFPKGLFLKRDATLQECKYILKTLLGFEVETRDYFEDKESYDAYNEDLAHNVNSWLKGDWSDDFLVNDYGGECTDMALGVMNLIPIICYLKKRGVIK